MINYLSIKNFALIDNSEIEFSKNLNIITGETGSGKSIIIQALAILLGGRASVDNIRTGADEAVLNAEISIENQLELKQILHKNGLTLENDDIILRRILTRNGKSKSYINGSPVTTKELSFVSAAIFDFHGQHDGVSLLKKQTHLKYLDNYLELKEYVQKLADLYYKIVKVKDEIKLLDTNKRDKEKKIELLTYQINEIEAANLKEHEYDEIKKEIKLLENNERIMNAVKEASQLLSDEEGLLSKMKQLKTFYGQIAESDDTFATAENEVTDIYYKLEDYSTELNSRLLHDNYDPKRLDFLNERSDAVDKLRRKYGNTYNDIMNFLLSAKDELESITLSEERKNKLMITLSNLLQEYTEAALEVSRKRKEGAEILEQKVQDELKSLAMENVIFSIELTEEEGSENAVEIDGKRVKYSPAGIDKAEFLISPNMGEPLKSLVKIASGGELSRVILALKKVLAKNDSVTTMIFDEIDSGIGGRVGLAVSKSLRLLAKSKQILCITHLPQIAAAGDTNFLISKKVINDRTVSTINVLKNNDKDEEISRMLSGTVTDSGIIHARELIEEVLKA